MARPFESPVLDRVRECQTPAEVTQYQYELVDRVVASGTLQVGGLLGSAEYSVMASGAEGFEYGQVEDRINRAAAFHYKVTHSKGEYAVVQTHDTLVAGVVRDMSYKLRFDYNEYGAYRRVYLGPVAVVAIAPGADAQRLRKHQFMLDAHRWPIRLEDATERAQSVENRTFVMGATAMHRWFNDQEEDTLEAYRKLATLISPSRAE